MQSESEVHSRQFCGHESHRLVVELINLPGREHESQVSNRSPCGVYRYVVGLQERHLAKFSLSHVLHLLSHVMQIESNNVVPV